MSHPSGNPTAISSKVSHQIYGSSRLGEYRGGRQSGQRTLGLKSYELSNHLGNVLAVISDRKLPVSSSGTVTHYEPDILSTSDYYPFGLAMDGRTFSGEGYRWGFEGQEEDRETDWVYFKYRMHSPKIGRFFAKDPLASEYPWNSPYAFSENKVIHMIELEGLEAIHPTQYKDSEITYVHTAKEGLVVTYHLIKLVHHLPDGTNSDEIVFDTYQYNSSPRANYIVYTLDYAAEWSDRAWTADRLAVYLDPGSSVFGLFFPPEKAERKKSVVGHFARNTLDIPSDKNISTSMSREYGKAFRHIVWSGMLYAFYGEDIAVDITNTNEKSNEGYRNIFKNNLRGGEQSMSDLVNNYWGMQHMKIFLHENGSIKTVDDFVNYLNYAADKITSSERFKKAMGNKKVEFSKDTDGVKDLYDYYKNHSKENGG